MNEGKEYIFKEKRTKRRKGGGEGEEEEGIGKKRKKIFEAANEIDVTESKFDLWSREIIFMAASTFYLLSIRPLFFFLSF